MPFPVSESDIKNAEEQLGQRLPDALRRRLMSDNGGWVDVGTDSFELFKVLDRSDRKRMARTASRDIVRENATLQKWTGFPQDVVAIAGNGAGDALVLVAGEDGRAQVLVWDHETGRLEQVGPPETLF